MIEASSPHYSPPFSGLKNAFRLEVRKAREQLGLDITTTNAPVNQMEELNQNDVVVIVCMRLNSSVI